MRLVIQRVKEASVKIDGTIHGKIDKGFVVFFGVGSKDTETTVDKYIKKMTGMRIFEDEEGKTNLALKDVGGQVLFISQFTLYADCKKGNRPSFINAGEPKEAERLYEYAVEKVRETVPIVETGIFGADMEVSLINDGPFTIILDESIL